MVMECIECTLHSVFWLINSLFVWRIQWRGKEKKLTGSRNVLAIHHEVCTNIHEWDCILGWRDILHLQIERIRYTSETIVSTTKTYADARKSSERCARILWNLWETRSNFLRYNVEEKCRVVQWDYGRRLRLDGRWSSGHMGQLWGRVEALLDSTVWWLRVTLLYTKWINNKYFLNQN